MENWVIGTKFIILLYCVIYYIQGDMTQIPLVILSLLVYISLSMIYYVLGRESLKRGMLLVLSAALGLSSVFINPLFIFLLPLAMVDLAASFTSDMKVWTLCGVLPAAICGRGLVTHLLLVSALCLTVYILSYRMYENVQKLRQENQKLRDRNEALQGRLDMGAEYESQLKYVTQIEERNSLAQKIHDKVGHTIAGSLIQLEAAALVLEKDQDKAREILGNVVNHLKDGMESIRSTLRNIKPAQEQLGINRLKVILDEFSVNNPIRTTLSYSGSLDAISQTQWKIIMDNMREALTNTLKYGAANAVKVDIQVMKKLVRAEIRDNGRGAHSLKKGLGIVGMEERTENAGGKLIIDGSNGFSIITLLPVGEVANADKSGNS